MNETPGQRNGLDNDLDNEVQVVVDIADDDRLRASLSRLPPDTQGRLLNALTDLRNGDLRQAILDNISDVIAREYPGSCPARGVVFRASLWGGVSPSRVETLGEILFADDSVARYEFEDIADALDDVYGTVPAAFTVAVNLETGTIDASAKRFDEHVNVRLRTPAPPTGPPATGRLVRDP